MGTAKQKGSQEKNGGADALLSACTQNSDESELFVGRFVFRSHFYRFWKIHSLDHVQCKWWRLRRTYTLDRCINRQQTQRSSDEASHFYLFANRAKQRRMEDHFLYLPISNRTRLTIIIIQYIRAFVAISMKPQALSTEQNKQNKLSKWALRVGCLLSRMKKQKSKNKNELRNKSNKRTTHELNKNCDSENLQTTLLWSHTCRITFSCRSSSFVFYFHFFFFSNENVYTLQMQMRSQPSIVVRFYRKKIK